MNLYNFEDILNNYSTSVAVYAKDLEEVKCLLREYARENQTEYDGEKLKVYDGGNPAMMEDLQEYIEHGEYKVTSVLDDEESRVILLSREMQKLLMYASHFS